MTREITCYVHDADDSRYATEYTVQIAPRAGYTCPTVGDLDTLTDELANRYHRTESALRRMAHSSPYTLAVEIIDHGPVRREEMSAELQEQADEIDAASVDHLR